MHYLKGVNFIKKISKIQPVIPIIKEKKKAAGYARVSKDTERLVNSVEAQVSYYKNLIQKKTEWEYAGVYADYGITGTIASKRYEFRRMISDCEAGKINIILTKSISRFARNTVDLLETVRYLKSMGIEVRFEKEHINTLSDEGELMLTLLASFAQEESSSISENVKWGVRKRFESGEIGTANKHILGYYYDEQLKKYIIIPEEQETIRYIFNMYILGIPLGKMAKKLNEAGICTVKGNKFTETALNVIIHNEVYAGDIRRQKSFIEDPVSKRKIVNSGQLPQYYMVDCHEAIIDRETWNKVQKEIIRRAGMTNPSYCFTGKIRCGICGCVFTRKKVMVKGKVYVYWICHSKKKADSECFSVNLCEEKLKQISTKILGLNNFEEECFKKQIDSIMVSENGSLEYHFKGGKIEKWLKV